MDGQPDGECVGPEIRTTFLRPDGDILARCRYPSGRDADLGPEPPAETLPDQELVVYRAGGDVMKVARMIVGVAVVAGALAGCSSGSTRAISVGTPPPRSTATATATATASATATATASASASATPTAHPNPVMLTAADNGRTVRVTPGAVISVRLAPNAGSYDPPVSDDETVLTRTSNEGGYPVGGDAIARFSALAPGTAHISSQTDLSCMHSNPRCMVATRVFTVTVIVARS
jgi:hypothetical protein